MGDADDYVYYNPTAGLAVGGGEDQMFISRHPRHRTGVHTDAVTTILYSSGTPLITRTDHWNSPRSVAHRSGVSGKFISERLARAKIKSMSQILCCVLRVQVHFMKSALN
jgi:hypothetical protein